MNKRVVSFINTGKKEYDELGYVETVAVCSLPIMPDKGEGELYKGVGEFIEHQFSKKRSSSEMIYVKDLTNNGKFIIEYLDKNGYEYTREKLLESEKEYSVVMSTGTIYQIKILVNTKPRRFINLYDIDKIVPLKIKDLNSGFGLNIQEYDISDIYNESNIKILLNNTVEYAKVMRYMSAMDLDGITLSSRAFASLKSSVDNYDFMYKPTVKEEYDFIQPAYDAGYNSINEEYKGKELQDVMALDVNSMFPSILRNEVLPFGEGVYYEGKCEPSVIYPLYIQRIRVTMANVKEGKTAMVNPYVGAMKSISRYVDNIDEVTEITMSNIMLDLFLENYNVYGLEYIDGYKYSAKKGSFNKFVDKWMDIKVSSENNGDVAMRTISKMVMNYSYGGFGKRRYRATTFLGEDGYETKMVEAQNRYLPIAIFITSYAIKELVDIKNELGDRFVYCDVDSIHILGHSVPGILENKVHPNKLGYWKIEGRYNRAKFLKLKTYIEENDDELVIKAAGAGDEVKEQMNFDNFNYGSEFSGMIKTIEANGGSFREEYNYKL